MAHNRKFVPGRMNYTKLRLLNSKKTVFIQDAIEKIIVDSGMLETAPFKWVGLLYRYGTKNRLKPEYGRINKKYGDIPIAVELRSDILKWADEYNLQLLKDIFMIAGLEAILHVCQKYKLPAAVIQEARAAYGDIPETIEECEAVYGRQPPPLKPGDS